MVNELFPSVLEPGTDRAERWRPDRAGDYCPRCGASCGAGGATPAGCAFCVGQRIAWHRIVRLGAYAPPLDARVRTMKFHGHWRWASRYGRLLGRRVGRPIDPQRIVVAPTPMHWLRRWRRGYNQAKLMAETLAATRGWPMVEALVRPRHTPPQTAVPVSGRAANVRGSFALAGVDLTGYEVVLVDDVKTSGATLSACVRLLREAGAVSVTAAVAAVADPQHAGFKRT